MDYLVSRDGYSYVQAPGVLPGGTTLAAEIERTSRRYPDRPALVDDVGALTYRQLWDAVLARARVLHGQGARAGDRVAVMLPNGCEYVVTALASYRLGTVLVPLATNNGLREVEGILAHSEAGVVVAGGGPRTRDLAGVVGDALADGRLGARLVALGEGPAAGGTRGALPSAPEPDAPAAMLYTSGTTGAPKGVVHTHEGLLRMAQASNAVRRAEGGVWLCLVPLSHALGLEYGLACPLISGGTLVLTDGFDARRALQAIAVQRVDHLVAVPTMVIRMLAAMDAACDVSSVRAIYLGGMAAPPEVMRSIGERFGCTISMTYGATEFGHASMTRPEDPAEVVAATSGGPMFGGLELRVMANERTVPIGEIGQIWVRGPTTFLEYFRDPVRTAAARRPSGWVSVEDLGYLSPGGTLTVVGRHKDMIVRGGQNLYPNEIELLLHRHPAVLMACVVPVPDPELGERTCACVVLADRAAALDRAAVVPLFSRVARHKIPDYVLAFDEFPQTSSGKVRKDRLAPLATARLGLAGAAGRDSAARSHG
ncbi:MAG TPA: class I adenylate-forming enzyme family protein [Gammaproteobacteria bacterium]|nr:class I adenylate-forming enzyme family protein [Gammaproteobacteria bacterium]